MSDNISMRILKRAKKSFSNIEEQIDVAKELQQTNKELLHNARLLENAKNHIVNIESAEQFEQLKNESKHIIRDLSHIKGEGDKIKSLGKQTISHLRTHRLKIKRDTLETEAKKIKIITVEGKEITRDEEHIIDFVENDEHSIKQALGNLTSFAKSKFNNESQSSDAQAMIARALIHLKQVYAISQAIVQLEAQVKKEEKELEEGIDKLTEAA
jgi:hypothetical protein